MVSYYHQEKALLVGEGVFWGQGLYCDKKYSNISESSTFDRTLIHVCTVVFGEMNTNIYMAFQGHSIGQNQKEHKM